MLSKLLPKLHLKKKLREIKNRAKGSALENLRGICFLPKTCYRKKFEFLYFCVWKCVSGPSAKTRVLYIRFTIAPKLCFPYIYAPTC